MRKTKQAAEWLRNVLPKHAPPGAEGVLAGLYTGEACRPPYNELYFDLDPEEGRVVELSDGWLLLQNNPLEFMVFAQDALEWVPPAGSDVRISPYVRRGFDGKRMDKQERLLGSGPAVQGVPRGLWRSPVPVDSTGLRSSSLLDLMDQIERLRAGDGIRRLSHVLVDAGAVLEPLKVCDASWRVSEPMSRRPSLTFRVRTQKADGWLTIETQPAEGGYTLRLTGLDGASLREPGRVFADVLASVIVDWIDDGQWRLARVEPLGADVN